MKLFAIFSIEICQFYHKQMTKSWSLDFTTEISSEFTLNFRERSRWRAENEVIHYTAIKINWKCHGNSVNLNKMIGIPSHH